MHLRHVISRRRRFCARNGIIDAGCGTGLVLAETLSAFAWGMGVDISPRMIRVARKKHLEGAKFVVADCFHLSSFCPKAGAVISRGVLLSHYGLTQGEELLRSARAALVRGGFTMFDFLNAGGRNRSQHRPENKQWFKGRQLTALARRAGFRKARILGEPGRRVRILIAE